MSNTPTHRPVCPNHKEPLEDCGFPLPKKGTGICPVSGCPFDFEVEIDEDETVKDKHGNIRKAKEWNVTGDEEGQS